MKKLLKFGQLNEADIKLNKGVSREYTSKVETGARQKFRRPSPDEVRNYMGLSEELLRLIRGHEEELTEVGKKIIMENYGNLLDNVELDIKIVNKNDEEKKKMVKKMIEIEPNEDKDEEKEEDVQIDQAEIDKRKIINNIMQGEGQNVHSMIYQAKEVLEAIDPDLYEGYMYMLDFNRKFDWNPPASLRQSLKGDPTMASAMEIDWKDEENKPDATETFKKLTMEVEVPEEEMEEALNGDGGPVIRVRCLDLPMLIHETVKGIYELIASCAIPSDEKVARKLLAQTDTPEDEQQDIQFGPFIAADIRNYLNKYFERKMLDNQSINIKEYIYGKMFKLDPEEFLPLIKGMLDDSPSVKNKVESIIDECIHEMEEYNRQVKEYDEIDEEPTVRRGSMKKVKEEPEEVDYSKMRKGELENILNKAIDEDDFETIKKIQQYL